MIPTVTLYINNLEYNRIFDYSILLIHIAVRTGLSCRVIVIQNDYKSVIDILINIIGLNCEQATVLIEITILIYCYYIYYVLNLEEIHLIPFLNNV